MERPRRERAIHVPKKKARYAVASPQKARTAFEKAEGAKNEKRAERAVRPLKKFDSEIEAKKTVTSIVFRGWSSTISIRTPSHQKSGLLTTSKPMPPISTRPSAPAWK